MDTNDQVHRPAHYNQGDVECLDAMVSAFGEDAVRQWAHLNSFKYLWRCGHKDDAGQDRKKAIFYARFANGDDPRLDVGGTKA